MQNARLDEAKAGINIARWNINNLRYADDTNFMAESKEEIKSLLMKVKEESEKAGLKLNIQETKIMASSPITSWQIDGETMETVTDFLFLGSKITVDGDCSQKFKDTCSLGKSYVKPRQHIKSRDITWLTRINLAKAMIFPVVMYGRGSWTIKKAEPWRRDTFELWCWRRLLRVPWTARKSNQSILKLISPNTHWKDWCWSSSTWPPNAKNWLTEKDPDAGKDWRQEEKGMTEDEMFGWHHWHESEQVLGVGDGQGILACCSPWGCKESDTTEQLNWSISQDQLFTNIKH